MAATAEKPSKPRKWLTRFPVRMGNVNLGDEVASLGFSTERANCTVETADQCFCGKRLNVRLVVGEGNPDQKEFWEDRKYDVQGIADSKSFRVSRKRIASSMVFLISGVDVEVLSHFAKQAGYLYVLKAEDAAEEESAEAETAEAEKDAQDEDND